MTFDGVLDFPVDLIVAQSIVACFFSVEKTVEVVVLVLDVPVIQVIIMQQGGDDQTAVVDSHIQFFGYRNTHDGDVAAMVGHGFGPVGDERFKHPVVACVTEFDYYFIY